MLRLLHTADVHLGARHADLGDAAAAQRERLFEARIRTVIIPGTHDCYDRSSIYRTYDLEALAGSRADDDFVTVLTPERPLVHLEPCDVAVHGVVFSTKR